MIRSSASSPTGGGSPAASATPPSHASIAPRRSPTPPPGGPPPTPRTPPPGPPPPPPRRAPRRTGEKAGEPERLEHVQEVAAGLLAAAPIGVGLPDGAGAGITPHRGGPHRSSSAGWPRPRVPATARPSPPHPRRGAGRRAAR